MIINEKYALKHENINKVWLSHVEDEFMDKSMFYHIIQQTQNFHCLWQDGINLINGRIGICAWVLDDVEHESVRELVRDVVVRERVRDLARELVYKNVDGRLGEPGYKTPIVHKRSWCTLWNGKVKVN